MPSTSRSSTAGTNSGGSFQAYFEGWMARQERFLDELVAARDHSASEFHENDLWDLITRARAQYEEFFVEKSRMANANVFLLFSPTWYTPLERSFLWIAGFKPGLTCRLAMTVDDLTEDQTERIRQLSHETKRQEKALNNEMAKIQETLAAPPLVDFARSVGQQPQAFQREIEDVDAMTESLKSSMLNMLNDADRLRTRTADRVVGILRPIQIVGFFAAAAELQLRLRNLGLQKEADRAHNSINNGW